MTKEELLQVVKQAGQSRTASREEMIAAFDEGGGSTEARHAGIADVLYYIGGAIVFLGISIFVWQNWSALGIGTKILATLGAGVAAYFVGLFLGRDERTKTVAAAFYFISALVIPIGLHVVFDYAGFDVGTSGMQSIISLLLLGMYFASFLLLRKSIFLLFSILFGTWFYYVCMSYLFVPSIDWSEHLKYLTLALGLSYIFLGYSFVRSTRESLTGFLYGVGVFAFLGAAISLGGWDPNQSIIWEVIFPGLVFAVLLVSVHLKSKAFLTFGSLYLMAYILKITGEYFTIGLGWPLALVIAGLMLIAVGYLTFYLKKQYISVA